MSRNKVADVLGSGTFYYKDYWDEAAQTEILAALAHVIAAAPLFVPRMPRTGQPWSITMTNAGKLGWVSIATAIAISRTTRNRRKLA